LIITGSKIWPNGSSPPKPFPLLLPAISGVVGFLFVLWQLSKQQFASIRIRVCENLMHKWLTTPPDPETDLVIPEKSEKKLPQAFLDMEKEVKDEWEWKWDWKWFKSDKPKKWVKDRLSACLICFTMLTFALMAMWRLSFPAT
jgi:hypothetical protein